MTKVFLFDKVETMKQSEIIKKLDGAISVGHLSDCINGKARPSWGLAKKLAKATGTHAVIWLDGTPAQIKKAISKAP